MRRRRKLICRNYSVDSAEFLKFNRFFEEKSEENKKKRKKNYVSWFGLKKYKQLYFLPRLKIFPLLKYDKIRIN